MDTVYYLHRSSGVLKFDPAYGTKEYNPWWALLQVGSGLIHYYRWLAERWGIPTEPNHLWGPHISVVKGEEPPDSSMWGKYGKFSFFYSNIVRVDNQKHAWLDAYSEELADFRCRLGLSHKVRFHITLGRLR